MDVTSGPFGEALYTLALWFELDELSNRQLSKAVSSLSRRMKSPAFVPHITIFGGLWLDKDTANGLVDNIVDACVPTKVEFGDVGYDDLWSRSVFLRVNPSEEMLAMHEAAGRVLGVSGPSYAPYLSLMYGELPREDKVEAVTALQLRLPESATVEAVSLWHTNPMGVSTWRCLRRVDLSY